jgi:nitrogen PTS system EIIA component
MKDLAHYLDRRAILFLNSTERDRALSELVDVLDRLEKLRDRDAFLAAVLAREKIVSTGIGMGVAIPHAKLPGYERFFIAIGIQKQGIPWDALDGAPVRMVFLVGGPDDKQTEYLQLLSRITVAIKDRERRKALLQAQTVEEILALFRYGSQNSQTR